MELKIKCVNTATSSDGSQYGKFVIEPLERGFGTTIGNSLRRVLLSSLEGTAVTGARIEGITHEYTAIGEMYSFLIVTDYEEEWDTLLEKYGNQYYGFAYVWNKDDDMCSEFGTIALSSFGGGIRRIG